jgi:hypothetical protein
VWPKHVAPLNKPLLTPYYRKESCDLTVINKAYKLDINQSAQDCQQWNQLT